MSEIDIPKTALVLVYFGEEKPWHYFFLKSCGLNEQFTWLIFGDTHLFKETYKNVKYFPLSFSDVKEMASEKTGIPIGFSGCRKFCDLKPAYGHIFEDYLNDYSYWGFVDEDVVYGNLSYLFEQENHYYDIYTSGSIIKGHFTILKNQSTFTKLYQQLDYWKEVFLSEIHYAFDETLWGVWSKKRIKNKDVSEYEPLGFHGIIKDISTKGHCRVKFLNYLKEGDDIENDIYIYDIKRKRHNFPCLYFHFLNLKNQKNFKEFKKKKNVESFVAVSKFGVTSSPILLISWKFRLLLRKIKKACFFYL